MHELSKKTLPWLAACLMLAQLAVSASPAGAQDTDDSGRKAKILANLQLRYPQLADMGVQMGPLGPSEYEGLDEGTFSAQGRTQRFLVSRDDKKLYLISGDPVDVSRSAEEIAVEQARIAAEKAKEAEGRVAELNDSIAGRPMRGKADAPVTIVEFSDFQCPYCARGAGTVEEILKKYGDDVKFVFKHYPLPMHPWARPAAIAAYCAGELDPNAFWTLHDKYFANQRSITPADVIAKSKEYLAGASIDMAQWSTCAEDQSSAAYKAAAAAVDADMAFGEKLGVTGTPGFFINGTFINGAQPISAFEPLIQQAKKEG